MQTTKILQVGLEEGEGLSLLEGDSRDETIFFDQEITNEVIDVVETPRD